MTTVYRCVHCSCSGNLCLNRSMRILNFAYDTEQEASRIGSFMVARVARSLFAIALRTRE